MEGQSFCVLPWVHCHVNTQGGVRACCISPVELGNLRRETLSQIWRGDAMHRFRAQHLSGQPVAACRRCYVEEAAGNRSLRQIANQEYGGRAADWVDGSDAEGRSPLSRPIDYDIRFSNVCNLKCRSCGHAFSSSWFTDAKEIWGITAGPKAIIRAFDSSDEFWGAFDGFVDDVQKITFAGGEPLLNDQHYEVLAALRARGKLDVFIYYLTNFTVLDHGGVDVTTLWRDFSNLHVQASLDGTGARGELLRHGQSWPVILDNRERLRRQCPGVKFRVSCTVGALNAWHLPDLHRELIETGFIDPDQLEVNILHEPSHLGAQILPAAFKQHVAARIDDHIAWLQRFGARAGTAPEALQAVIVELRSFAQYMLAADQSSRLRHFRRFCELLDERRGENTAAVFPEVASLLS